MVDGPFLSSSWYRVAKLRPRLRAHVSVSRHRYRGESWYVLHDHATGRLVRLRPATYSIVGRMDGSRGVDELWRGAAGVLGEEAPSQDELIQLLSQLSSADLLQSEVSPDTPGLIERAGRAQRMLWVRNLLNPLAYRMRFWHPDKFFERTIPFVRWAFSRGGAAIWLAVVAPALVLAALNWSKLSSDLSSRILASDNVLAMALVILVLKCVHELGHGYAVKVFGGAVHEIGVMFLVLIPMPYVDASAAAEFRSKWRRALVGAAGMIVETFFAALAFYVWLAVEPGTVRSIAYNFIFAAGVATILFNGNPLLKYDGYYIFSDLVEIPNLGQRAAQYWLHLLDRYVFRIEGPDFRVGGGAERAWLAIYAPASFAYRQLVMLAIALFIAAEYRAIGVALAIWSILLGLAFPIGKGLWQITTAPRYRRNRRRVVSLTAGGLALAFTFLFLIPLPLSTTTEGVVWLPDSAYVRARTGGFLHHLAAEPGAAVATGEVLIESEDSQLRTQIEALREHIQELEARLSAERISDRVAASVTTAELGYARAELGMATDRDSRLRIISPAAGIFHVERPQDLPGRYVKQGQLLGYVLPFGSRIVRATVGQDDIDLVRSRLRRVVVILAERVEDPKDALLVREIPAAQGNLPSRALGGPSGGATAVDPRDPKGVKTLQRVFYVDLELPSSLATAFGSRVEVRFEHQWEPVGMQMWRRGRQLILSRLQI
jgi:putative peptide zinc metalloprotease protein